MTDLIPPFDFHRVIVTPWTDGFTSFGWVALMGFFVASSCGLIGNYLILRRMSLVGDAISHSILPGIAIAFLLANSRSTTAMFIGALIAGVLTTVIIELIHKKSRVKQDAAIGIAFTTLFAIGVILISLYADKVDLDQECVLYGEIAFVSLQPLTEVFGVTLGPEPVVRMGFVTVMTAVLIIAFYKELLVSSFDPGLAASLGINAGVMHYALMSMLSVVVVSAFESVGAILVIAMLILPGATATLISQRLPAVLLLSVLHAALSSLVGVHLGLWLQCSVAAAMVVAGTVFFVLAWFLSPRSGLIARWTKPLAPIRPIELQPGPSRETAQAN
jgi:manganese/zinc/iron transport system permease protein